MIQISARLDKMTSKSPFQLQPFCVQIWAESVHKPLQSRQHLFSPLILKLQTNVTSTLLLHLRLLCIQVRSAQGGSLRHTQLLAEFTTTLVASLTQLNQHLYLKTFKNLKKIFSLTAISGSKEKRFSRSVFREAFTVSSVSVMYCCDR